MTSVFISLLKVSNFDLSLLLPLCFAFACVLFLLRIFLLISVVIQGTEDTDLLALEGICLSRRKQRAFKKARATNKQSDWHRYKKIQKEAQQACRRAHDDYISNMVSEPGSNNKKLFVYINDMKFDSSGVTPLKKDGISYSEPTDQVEILNEQFVSAFTKEDCTSIPTMGNNTVNSAPPPNIQVNGVKKLLLGQKPHKASGPDQISSRFLKEMASSVAPALTLIYQASYEQAQIPDDWKRVFVTSLFKKGARARLLTIGQFH